MGAGEATKVVGHCGVVGVKAVKARKWGADGITSFHEYEGGSCTFTARRLWRAWYWSPGVGLIFGDIALAGAWEAIAADLERSAASSPATPEGTK